jgi:hypothetical protein
MSKRRSRPPDTAPGADPEKDCLDPEEIDFARANEELVEGTQPAKQEQNVNWGDLDGESEEQIAVINSWAPARAGWLRFLERIALLIERPANRLIGTAQLNPFYHTGTIAVLLLAIVGLTGFYLFVFFKYGFDASYNDVLTRIEEPFIARTIWLSIAMHLER